jgi:putative transposase
VADRLHRGLALAALRKALALRRPKAGLTHHSDRGSQYCSADYQAELRSHGILISMWRTLFDTRRDAERAIGRYIDGFYNPVRRHSALDFTSPVRFEKMAAD